MAPQGDGEGCDESKNCIEIMCFLHLPSHRYAELPQRGEPKVVYRLSQTFLKKSKVFQKNFRKTIDKRFNMWYYTSVILRQQVHVKAKLPCRGDMKKNFSVFLRLGVAERFFILCPIARKSLAFYYLERVVK
ncbi:MAG: hypothetical protein IJX27_09155 [Clostridia bacterium]|nr:hypothetical protein [Clostridia bacterium]